MSETILVVEDEPALRQLIAGALAAQGYYVHQARNGAEAIDIFNQHGPAIDLVITDLEMPYIDGRALIDELRERRKSLKVLCISGSTQSPPASADAYLGKPFARDVLLAQVRALFARR